MPSFAFDSGSLVPATHDQPVTSPLSSHLRSALRDYLLDVIEADLFPIEWSEEDEPVLTAMDPSGQVVTAWVTDALDGPGLMRALTRAGETVATPWLSLAGRYRDGVGSFRRDWNAFREARPPGAQPGPRLYVVAGEVTREVLEAARVLHGVRLFSVDTREQGGRQILDVTPLQPAAARILDGQTIHEIEPSAKAVSAATPATTAEASSAATPETTDEVEPVVAPTPQEQTEHAGDSAPAATAETAAETAELADSVRPAGAAKPAEAAEPTQGADAADPAEADPALQAVADLVGAPMPIEYHDGVGTHQAVLTPQGSVRVGERTVSTIEQAARVVGGEPARAWHDWHVAGFPMSEARAEATGTALPSARGRRARRGGARVDTVPGSASRH